MINILFYIIFYYFYS